MKLKGKQFQFMQAMLESPTIQQAIETTNIARSTAYKYLADDNFNRELLRARADAMSQVTARLQLASEVAVDTIIKLMEDTETPPHTRLQSARTILENAYKGIELEHIIQQMEEVESYLEERNQ